MPLSYIAPHHSEWRRVGTLRVTIVHRAQAEVARGPSNHAPPLSGLHNPKKATFKQHGTRKNSTWQRLGLGSQTITASDTKCGCCYMDCLYSRLCPLPQSRTGKALADPLPHAHPVRDSRQDGQLRTMKTGSVLQWTFVSCFVCGRRETSLWRLLRDQIARGWI